MKEIWFSNVGGREDIILLQGRHSFDPRYKPDKRRK